MGVGAGYLYYNVTDKDVDDGLVFAQVSVPISDWWGGAHALKKARIREQQAENDRLQAREMLAVEIERTWSEVQESYAQILLTAAFRDVGLPRTCGRTAISTRPERLRSPTCWTPRRSTPGAATTSPRHAPLTGLRWRVTCV